MRVIFTSLVLFSFYSSFAQLLRFDELEESAVIFKYQKDYESIVKKNKVKTHSSALKMGSHTGKPEYCEYDKEGRLIRDKMIHRVYDQLGNLAQKLKINNYLDGRIDTLEVTTFEYDDKNKVSKKTIWYKSKSEWIPNSSPLQLKAFKNKTEVYTFKNSYDPDGLLISQDVIRDGTFVGKIYYTYNANKEIAEYKKVDKEENMLSQFNFSYDSSGKLISVKADNRSERIITYNAKEQVIFAFEGIEYFPNGLIKSTYQNSETEGMKLIWNYTYKYYK